MEIVEIWQNRLKKRNTDYDFPPPFTNKFVRAENNKPKTGYEEALLHAQKAQDTPNLPKELFVKESQKHTMTKMFRTETTFFTQWGFWTITFKETLNDNLSREMMNVSKKDAHS